MLTDSADPTRLLIEVKDLNPTLTALIRDYGHTLDTVLGWAHEYLVKPHPDLGRKGPVCPFTQGSLDRGLFYLAVYRGQPSGPDEVSQALMHYRDWFLELDSAETSRFRTVLVLFPDIVRPEARTLIETSQQALKADYVRRGLMIGEFHDGPPDKPGLWNDDFRPLYSPVPLLAIRKLVPTDFPFLSGDRNFVEAYLANFDQNDIPARLTAVVAAAAAEFGLPQAAERTESPLPGQTSKAHPPSTKTQSGARSATEPWS